MGCSEQDDWAVGTLGEGNEWVVLNFGDQTFQDIEISTRSTVGEIAESRLMDFYALIFVGDKCVYNRHFSDTMKKNSRNEVVQAANNKSEECWWVQNRTTSNNTSSDNTTADTRGTLCMKAPNVTGAELYLIANANAYTVNISPELLGIVQTKKDLQNIVAKLNGDVVTRYGYFPMVAEVTNVTITENAIRKEGNAVTAELVRLDAKISVNVTAAVGATTHFNGKNVVVREFIPTSWKVMNVPKATYVLGGETQDASFFNTLPSTFEEKESVTYNSQQTFKHSFSFYMLENKYMTTNTPNYHQRDLRKKDGNGKYLYDIPEGEDDVKDIWVYAPANSTYLILKGTLLMTPSVQSGELKEVGADVTYYIHLGNFGNHQNGSPNNYAVERNTHYTYDIYIKGIDKIEAEVRDGKEEQTGAVGDIYASQELIYRFDAHYEQLAHFLPVSDIEDMSWYVDTPFGLDGSPKANNNLDYKTQGTLYEEELKNYDYKWFWVMINPIKDGKYDEKNQWYPGDKYKTGGTEKTKPGDEKHLMTVDEFIRYMSDQKMKYLEGKEHIFKNNGNGVYGVAITIFVDEFYYEKHPLDGTSSTVLWKEFVNQDERLFHLYRVNTKSKDEESSVTNSIITIRQRSIQTPFNVQKQTLSNGWGCEVIDETADSYFYFYSPNESVSNNNNRPTALTTNNSRFNGMYNTAILWGVLNSNTTYQEVRWDTYLDYNRPNNYTPSSGKYSGYKTFFLKDNYATMRYATLLRNRDNDGDGVIDANEIRWYIASIDQLYGLYLGELGMSPDAKLYSEERAAQNGTYGNGHPYNGAAKWRSHVVSSTSTGGHPVTLWGEEGISISNYGDRHNKPAPYSTRSVRNLGIDHPVESEARTSLADENKNTPTKLVRVIPPAYVTKTAEYKFDLTNINIASRRFPTELELEPQNEHGENSRVSDGFITGEYVSTGTYQNKLYNDLLAGNSPCEPTWRVPNVREGAIMALYTASGWWNGNIIVSSFYSNGPTPWGNGKDTQSPSWQFGHQYVSIGNPGEAQTRSVKDWIP